MDYQSGRIVSLTAVNQEAIRSALTAAGLQFLESGEAAQGAGAALSMLQVD